MITIVCYSHSDYEDILQVQDAFLRPYAAKKILITNVQPKIAVCFDEVLLYGTIENYSDRLASCLSRLNDEYILFFHEMDIPIRFDPERLEELAAFMRERAIHRVDLQYLKYYNPNNTHVFHDIRLVENSKDNYRYNVNPSIWNVGTFRTIMSASSKSYRDIECAETQALARQYNMYKLHCDQKIRAGYFHVTPLFVFLHITHHNQLLPRSDNNLDEWLSAVYTGILATFTFRRDVRKNALHVYSEPKRPEHICEL